MSLCLLQCCLPCARACFLNSDPGLGLDQKMLRYCDDTHKVLIEAGHDQSASLLLPFLLLPLSITPNCRCCYSCCCCYGSYYYSYQYHCHCRPPTTTTATAGTTTTTTTAATTITTSIAATILASATAAAAAAATALSVPS